MMFGTQADGSQGGISSLSGGLIEQSSFKRAEDLEREILKREEAIGELAASNSARNNNNNNSSTMFHAHQQQQQQQRRRPASHSASPINSEPAVQQLQQKEKRRHR